MGDRVRLPTIYDKAPKRGVRAVGRYAARVRLDCSLFEGIEEPSRAAVRASDGLVDDVVAFVRGRINQCDALRQEVISTQNPGEERQRTRIVCGEVAQLGVHDNPDPRQRPILLLTYEVAGGGQPADSLRLRGDLHELVKEDHLNRAVTAWLWRHDLGDGCD